MVCKNHPETPATGRCAGCAESFCDNCLVDIQGQRYCGACKVMALKGQPLIAEEATVRCAEAKEALTYAIIGLFCFGIILGPVAIVKAIRAKKLIAENPRYSGAGQATAALVIGIITIVLWVLGIVSRIAAIQ